MEVLEGACQTLKQSGLPLVAVGMNPELAGSAQQTSEHVHDRAFACDRYAERRPINLHLLTRAGFEAAFDGFVGFEALFGSQSAYIVGQNAPSTGVL